MIAVIKHELKRYPVVFALGAAVYLVLFFLNFLIDTESEFYFDNYLILFYTFLFGLFLVFLYFRDEFGINRLLYLKSHIGETKILLGKLAVILILSFFLLIFEILCINLKALIFRSNNLFEFIRLNLDSMGFFLLHRRIFEWFYPVNYLMNLLLILSVVIALVYYFHYQKGKLGIRKAIIYFAILIPIVVYLNTMVFDIVQNFDKYLPLLDFNNLHPRIKAMRSEYLINFYSLYALILYGLIIVGFIRFSVKIKGEREL